MAEAELAADRGRDAAVAADRVAPSVGLQATIRSQRELTPRVLVHIARQNIATATTSHTVVVVVVLIDGATCAAHFVLLLLLLLRAFNG